MASCIDEKKNKVYLCKTSVVFLAAANAELNPFHDSTTRNTRLLGLTEYLLFS